MNAKIEASQIISMARQRGLIVQPQDKGYLLEIPLFKEVHANAKTTEDDEINPKKPTSYLPYCVASAAEIKTVADRLWRNENYKKMVQKTQQTIKAPQARYKKRQG